MSFNYSKLPGWLKDLISAVTPRNLHQHYAANNRFYWHPCPICGRDFGAHERADVGLIFQVGKEVGFPLGPGEAFQFRICGENFDGKAYTVDMLLCHPDVISIKSKAVCRRCEGEAERRNQRVLRQHGLEEVKGF